MCTPVCGSGDGAGPVIGRLVVLKPELLLRCECRFMKVQCCLSVKVKLFFFLRGGYDGNDHRAAVYTGKQSFLFVFFFPHRRKQDVK